MNKVAFVLKEMWSLIKRHKYYFLAPIVIILASLAILVYYIGPSAIVSFLYAGI